jgi:hypothetical protein
MAIAMQGSVLTGSIGRSSLTALVLTARRWQQLCRSVRTLLLPHTSHCMHWFKARAQYTTALAELADAWYQHE